MSSIADLFKGQKVKQDFKVDWNGGLKQDYKVDFAYVAPGTPANTTIPVAAFTQSVNTGNFPLSVTFTDATANTPTSWLWTFSDGQTSTLQNPTMTFKEEGLINVTLVATNSHGQGQVVVDGAVVVTAPFIQPPVQVVEGTPKPVVALVANVTSGAHPLTVQFTDNSTGNPTSWEWDFGDSDMSTVQNPSYTFTRPGTYDITLMVTGAGGSATGTRAAYITVT